MFGKEQGGKFKVPGAHTCLIRVKSPGYSCINERSNTILNDFEIEVKGDNPIDVQLTNAMILFKGSIKLICVRCEGY